jgi:hypothetical protein
VEDGRHFDGYCVDFAGNLEVVRCGSGISTWGSS